MILGSTRYSGNPLQTIHQRIAQVNADWKLWATSLWWLWKHTACDPTRLTWIWILKSPNHHINLCIMAKLFYIGLICPNVSEPEILKFHQLHVGKFLYGETFPNNKPSCAFSLFVIFFWTSQNLLGYPCLQCFKCFLLLHNFSLHVRIISDWQLQFFSLLACFAC